MAVVVEHHWNRIPGFWLSVHSPEGSSSALLGRLKPPADFTDNMESPEVSQGLSLMYLCEVPLEKLYSNECRVEIRPHFL